MSAVNKYKKNNKNFWLGLIILILLVYIYKSIFLYPVTSAGDLPYYWNTHISELALPTLWNPHWPTGLGGESGDHTSFETIFLITYCTFC